MLEDSNIDSDGACHLASALCTSDTQQKLYLMHNPIGLKGATAFDEMLLKNKSLKKLDLRDDSIGEEGAQKFTDSLTHNTTIEMLKLPEKYKLFIASSGVDSRVSFPTVLNILDGKHYHCKNIGVTSTEFWSSQLHACCVRDMLQTSKDASNLIQSLSVVEKLLLFVKSGSCRKPSYLAAFLAFLP